jgi:phage-related holin
MANVDLRPMSLGEVLDRTFSLYRENFLLFAGIMALPYILVLLFRFALLLFTRASITTSAPQLPTSGMVGGFILGGIGAAIVFLLVVGVVQAATVSAVSELYLGRDTSVMEAFAQSKGSILIVVAIMLMSGIATFVGCLFLIIPGIYLACRLAVSVPVAIVEKESPVASMERSMELTKGFAMQVFLLLLLVFVVSWIVGMLIQAPVMIFAFKAALAKQQPSIGVMAYSYVAEFISQVLVGPIGTISAALMYYNLRVRKEGFDIQHLMNSLGSAVPRPLADPPGIR